MLEQLNYEGIEFPVATKHYGKREEQNSIIINDILNLLSIAKDEKKHHVLIKEFDSLMLNKTTHKNKKYFCTYCLQCFSTEEILSNNKVNCLVINGEQAIRMPQKGKKTLQFQNHHRQMLVPFVINADFEAITEKIQGCQPNNTQSCTDKYQKHTGCSYGYKVVCCYDDKYTKPV
ncbi:unnamed protein product [Porites evermanni]|uniref:Uncharacterized protein n=1 Tax=Porites evermanni TaxID=104178 RepID=A0ABN8REY5_9CNID|nr:unnamed protein product [Porites evermanni]